jgi:hypothetical protein
MERKLTEPSTATMIVTFQTILKLFNQAIQRSRPDSSKWESFRRGIFFAQIKDFCIILSLALK